MTHNVEKLIRQSARSASIEWSGTADGQADLEQDLWVWYLESPGTQQTLDGMEARVARTAVREAGLQILAGQALEGDVFQGRALYSSESVKDALKGRSTNRYLRDILPDALRALEGQNEGYAEALRLRYDDGVIPQDSRSQDALKNAHKAITSHVNILAIERGDAGSDAINPDTRKKQGAQGDPTSNMALALYTEGDAELDLTDKDGNVTGTTTLRAEFDAPSIFDVGIERPTLRYIRGGGELADGVFNGGDRSELYRAQVFPELFPHEKPMLIENWSAEDREMYCGGIYTPGYLRLVKGDG